MSDAASPLDGGNYMMVDGCSDTNLTADNANGNRSNTTNIIISSNGMNTIPSNYFGKDYSVSTVTAGGSSSGSASGSSGSVRGGHASNQSVNGNGNGNANVEVPVTGKSYSWCSGTNLTAGTSNTMNGRDHSVSSVSMAGSLSSGSGGHANTDIRVPITGEVSAPDTFADDPMGEEESPVTPLMPEQIEELWGLKRR
jgi:hypothetical protein